MARRYHLDASTRRHGNLVVGGSPLRLFRLTDAGVGVVDRIAAEDVVDDSRLVTTLLDAGAIHPLPDGGPFSRRDVTVVTPTLGVPRHRVEGAIVVDDGSTPPVDRATVRLETNRGPAAARNVGLTDVTTPLVAFVDGDVEVHDAWLDGLLPHFGDDRVALVAPRVRPASVATALGRYEAEHHPLDLGADPANIRPGSRVSYVPGAALVCRVDAIRRIGGFDPDLRVGEDVDLVWRLVEDGWTCRYEPGVEVRHDVRPDWSSWFAQRVAYGSSAAPLAARHTGALTPLRTNVWSLATWLLGAVGRPLAGAVVGFGSAAMLVRRLPELPPRVAFRLAADGNLRAGEQIGAAVRRAWWPLVAVAAVRSRVARRVLVASLAAGRSPLRVLDDAAYSIGVWRGVLATGNIDPLVPTVAAWPPRAGRRRSRSATSRYRRTT